MIFLCCSTIGLEEVLLTIIPHRRRQSNVLRHPRRTSVFVPLLPESRPCTCVQLVLIHNACASSLPIRHVRGLHSSSFFNITEFLTQQSYAATAFVSGSPVFDLATLQPVWLTLHIAGGQVLLPLAVLTFLFTSNFAGRHLTLINFCITWIIYSVLYCIL